MYKLREFLIFPAIVIISVYFIFLAVNPNELIKRGRDSVRIHDLNNLSANLNSYVKKVGSSNLSFCENSEKCSGTSDEQNYYKADGTGWVKINLNKDKTQPFGNLPKDPINNNIYHFSYYFDGKSYNISAQMESDLFQKKFTNSQTPGTYSLTYDISSN